ncbi:gas vesicle protein GvpG [Streptomyces sp. NPDC001046]|uniref:gas vesicle protein GvpG n=1 Tax=unclassified Streptomyces TaxID=2593676 RepID=UPI00363A554F
MGLVSGLLLLPLAPVRGTLWVADHLLQEAERLSTDPRAVHARLAELDRALEAGEIDEAAFEAEEERLLARLGSPVRYAGHPPPSPACAGPEARAGARDVPPGHQHGGGGT